MAEQRKFIRAGSLWSHKDKDGVTFLSGNIEKSMLPKLKEGKVALMIFKNKWKKEGSKEPVYNVFIPADEYEGEEQPEYEKKEEGDEVPF